MPALLPLISTPGVQPGVEENRTRELAVAAVALILLNLPLWQSWNTAPLAFSGTAVQAGEWWRLLTHPWMHVTREHAVWDVSAFLLLYASLPMRGVGQRWLAVGCSALGSLAVAWLMSPLIREHGLCGLSGIGHGLMALVALGAWQQAGARRVAGLTLAGLGVKCLYELWTGQALFGGWYGDRMGVPIVECHAGGVLGALGYCGGRHLTLHFRRRGDAQGSRGQD